MRLIQLFLSVSVVAAFDSCSYNDDPNNPANAELMTFTYYRDNVQSNKIEVNPSDFIYKVLLYYLNDDGKYSLDQSRAIAKKLTSFGCWCQQRTSLPVDQEPGRIINRLDELCRMHSRCKHCTSIDYFSANNGCSLESPFRQNCQVTTYPHRLDKTRIFSRAMEETA